ncbi:MAG: hypothetical protein M3R17_21205 [Bacteroidota bacterium]|nr:hypothetical protein [Bacteroidota bacterium]
MKKFLAIAAVAGMSALVSCGGADKEAQRLQDSTRMADSMIAEKKTADSIRMNDSINKAAMEEAMAAQMKRTADSLHQDSIDKKLIKMPK